MRFEDLLQVYQTLKYNNPEKRAFIEKLKHLSPYEAEHVLYSGVRTPFHEHELFLKARGLGLSRKLVLEACRWVLQEDFWRKSDIRRL